MSARRLRAVWLTGVLALTVGAGGVMSSPALAVSDGSAAADGAYRFVAKLDIGSDRRCAGVLVDPQWVVTAATCFAQGTAPVPAGPPAKPTTATIGRTNLSGTGGYVLSVVELVPRTDRDLVLARLASLVPDIPPLPVATTAPTTGEVLRAAGYGRTSTEWITDKLATALFTVQSSTATTVAIAGSTANASPCRGDAGGPAFRESTSRVELLAVHGSSWQHGCLGVSETRQGATETRVDDIASWFVRSPITLRWQSDAAMRTLVGNPVAAEVIDGQLRYQEFQTGRVYWTEATGVHVVRGAILDAYLRLGAHGFLGAPTTDETPTPDKVGVYNHFTKPGQDGSIYHTPATGAHAVYGAIRQKWSQLGWEAGPLGYPTTDETPTPDGVGRYNHFNGTGGGSIYHTAATGSHAVYGNIRQKWSELGWEKGLGYPTTDETPTPDGVGRYNHFSNSNGASIYFSPGSGAHAIIGAIRQKWSELGWEAGPLAYPTTDETSTPDNVGRYNHFSGGTGGSIYFTPGTGAHEVYGAIRQRWVNLGWERSYLGYPTSGEFADPGGRRNNFERGYIRIDLASGVVTDSVY